MGKRKRSGVWEYFEKVSVDESKCNICRNIVQNRGNTSNLWGHIQRRHRKVLNLVNDIAAHDGISITNVQTVQWNIDDPEPAAKQTALPVLVPDGKRKHSGAWEYFEKVSIDESKCKICGNIIQTKGNTSNLWCHVQRRHKKVLNLVNAIPDHDGITNVQTVQWNIDDPEPSNQTAMPVLAPDGSSNTCDAAGSEASDAFVKQLSHNSTPFSETRNSPDKPSQTHRPEVTKTTTTTTMGSQQFCLKWNNHQLNMLSMFDELLHDEAFVDVTLACDGLSLKAHKMVLSACSPYFKHLFMQNPCKHPIVILKDVRYDDLKAIVDFMYKGEVNVSQDELSVLLRTAETLKVKGLAEVTGQTGSANNSSAAASGAAASSSSQQQSVASSSSSQTNANHHQFDLGARTGRTSPPAKRKKRHGGALAAALATPSLTGSSANASGHIQQALASLHVPGLQFGGSAVAGETSSSIAATSSGADNSRDLRCVGAAGVDDVDNDESRTGSSDEGGLGVGGGVGGGSHRHLQTLSHRLHGDMQHQHGVSGAGMSSDTAVKEEREDSEPDEPPDGSDELILDSGLEHIEIKPMSMNMDFNGSELESGASGGANYDNAFGQSFQSAPGTSGGVVRGGHLRTATVRMPRVVKRSPWTVDSLQNGITEVLINGNTITAAAHKTGIPFETLRRYVIKVKNSMYPPPLDGASVAAATATTNSPTNNATNNT